jgi:hypothetical protein
MSHKYQEGNISHFLYKSETPTLSLLFLKANLDANLYKTKVPPKTKQILSKRRPPMSDYIIALGVYSARPSEAGH